MDQEKQHRRYLRIWKCLYPFMSRFMICLFRIKATQIDTQGPCLIVSNHANVWDPLILSVCLKNKQAYYVASEHLFRKKFVSGLLHALVGMIARRKGNSAADTVVACLRHIKAGHSIVLYPEGELSWDGLTHGFFPATGKLAKRSGASLVTVRAKGDYLSLPRWGSGIRKGKIEIGPVHVYSPDELAGMTPEEINAAIERDIREDAWETQENEYVRYHGKNPAKGLERALFWCPDCKKIGALHSGKDRLTCTCGFSVRYGESGFFEPDAPYRTVAQWDAAQFQALEERDFPHTAMEPLFSDSGAVLTRIGQDHVYEKVAEGGIAQYEDRLLCADKVFSLADIRDMAIVRTHLLLFRFGEEYYEIRVRIGVNLRKYLGVWKGQQHGLLSSKL